MFNAAFVAFAEPSIDLYPMDLRAEIDALNDDVYSTLNNGVYRAGFATTQIAYEEAFVGVFAMLDVLEKRIAAGPYPFGGRLTEADIRVFVTLARFDAAYHGVFKCNLRRIADYPNLSAYLARLIAIPAFRDTFSLDQIRRSYYSIKALNPRRIVPLGPELPWASEPADGALRPSLVARSLRDFPSNYSKLMIFLLAERTPSKEAV